MALRTRPVSTPNFSPHTNDHRSRRTVWRALSAALVSVVATGVVTTAPGSSLSPASAAPTWRIPRGSTYVALGDSTAAFNEDRLYIDSSRSSIECWVRYANTYPKRLAAARGLRLVDASCGGATSKDYFRDQKKFVKKNARLVTLTFGGNDLRVFKSMDEAARTLGDAQINQAGRAVQKKVEDRLVRIMRDIGKRAPRAQIVVVGYLPLTDGTACPQLRTISAKESAQIKQKRDMIDRLLQRAGKRAVQQMPGRVKVLPLRHVRGHSACAPDSQRYISLLNLQGVWFHTNNAGHTYVARRIGQLLR